MAIHTGDTGWDDQQTAIPILQFRWLVEKDGSKRLQQAFITPGYGYAPRWHNVPEVQGNG